MSRIEEYLSVRWTICDDGMGLSLEKLGKWHTEESPFQPLLQRLIPVYRPKREAKSEVISVELMESSARPIRLLGTLEGEFL